MLKIVPAEDSGIDLDDTGATFVSQPRIGFDLGRGGTLAVTHDRFGPQTDSHGSVPTMYWNAPRVSSAQYKAIMEEIAPHAEALVRAHQAIGGILSIDREDDEGDYWDYVLGQRFDSLVYCYVPDGWDARLTAHGVVTFWRDGVMYGREFEIQWEGSRVPWHLSFTDFEEEFRFRLADAMRDAAWEDLVAGEALARTA